MCAQLAAVARQSCSLEMNRIGSEVLHLQWGGGACSYGKKVNWKIKMKKHIWLSMAIGGILLGIPSVNVPAAVRVSSTGSRAAFVIHSEPSFVYLRTQGFSISVGSPYDIVYYGGRYYLNHNGRWYRSYSYRGPWILISNYGLPSRIRRYRLVDIRRYRDIEYRKSDSRNNRYQRNDDMRRRALEQRYKSPESRKGQAEPNRAPGGSRFQQPPMRAPESRRVQEPPKRAPEGRNLRQPPTRAPENRRVQEPPMKAPEGSRFQQPPTRAPEIRKVQERPMRAPEGRNLQQPPMRAPENRKAQEPPNRTPEGRNLQERPNTAPEGRKIQEQQDKGDNRGGKKDKEDKRPK